METIIRENYNVKTGLGVMAVMVVDESASFCDLLKECKNKRERELAYGLIAYETNQTSDGVLCFYQLLLKEQPVTEDEIREPHESFLGDN